LSGELCLGREAFSSGGAADQQGGGDRAAAAFFEQRWAVGGDELQELCLQGVDVSRQAADAADEVERDPSSGFVAVAAQALGNAIKGT
jgi:hypothetical protein